MNSTRALICFLAASLMGCGGTNSRATQSLDLGSEVTLAPGASAAFKPAGIVVQFVGIAEDSRCPRDATCMWAGEVKALLSIRNTRQQATRHEVLESEHVMSGEYRITLARVRPEPVASAKIPPEAYRATLQLQKP